MAKPLLNGHCIGNDHHFKWQNQWISKTTNFDMTSFKQFTN